MRSRRAAVLILVLSLAAAAPAAAQGDRPGPAAALARFESWRVELPPASRGTEPAGQLLTAEKNRTRRALIGGGIGAAAGVLACTVVSTLANDSADGGLSFCPLDSYLLIGGGGFLVGAAIGWLS
jgi:hypothetical protein